MASRVRGNRKIPRQNAGLSRARAEFVKLEKRLVLAAWLNHLFGYRDNRELLQGMKDVDEGFDPEGRSHLYHHLRGRGDKVRVDLLTLAGYDDNIRRHLEAMNCYRPDPIRLRYFQHLAVLFTEIVLDRILNHRASFLVELNRFVDQHNGALPPGEDPYVRFENADLDKMAFWMATGSGKTLIMHFNYRQFLHYYRRPLDNILLITPNEGMTEQHLEEMRLSGIPCERFQNTESGLGLGGRDVVRVIEIHKLVEEKKGSGVSVPVEAFEGNNLIFVDEGHKGSGGQEWRQRREDLGKTGFTFEYSATFGQALTAARNRDLVEEYGKAIVFDYSYKYFYEDGFGKDFRVLNLREDTSEEMTDTLLLANLLSFYEQQRAFGDDGAAARAYNLEAPLWIFVGSSVNAVYREAGRERSDVLTVARFLHHFLRNERDWAVNGIDNLLDGKSGLEDTYGVDVFDGRFKHLKQARHDARSLYAEIVRSVFNADGSAGLHMAAIRGSQGELGLKASPTGDYFGVIYIGDTAAFRKLVEADDSGIILDPDDAFTSSLFGSVNLPRSSIKVLVGAKKFIEGWSSWRVSNMGLLNIGRGEGSEIIQLFGRGVRLRGKDFSLKRSSPLDSDRPDHLGLLETLEIFAVRANYMGQFRDYLEHEGVDTEGSVEIPLRIRCNEEFLDKGLLTLRLPAGKESSFTDDCNFMLTQDKAASVAVDLSPRVEEVSSSATGLKTAAAHAGTTRRLDGKFLDLLDWLGIYLELLEYAETKGYGNLAIPRAALREIVDGDSPLYRLTAPETIVQPQSFANLGDMRDAVLTILRAYVDRFYRIRHQRWDSEHMIYRLLLADDPNLSDYTVRVSRSNARLAKEIEELIKEGQRIYEEEIGRPLPNIHFDRHLYQPLLVEAGDNVKSEPPGLKPSERDFVKQLKDYIRAEANQSLSESQVFLLRNLSHGKGISFFRNHGFSPDFILWVKTGGTQRIVFIEPHGMLHELAYKQSDRLRLHERLSELERRLKPPRGVKVELDAYTISVTPIDELKKYAGWEEWDNSRFAAAHILFSEDEYLPALFAGAFELESEAEASRAAPPLS
ncbi:MAG: DEAD/DEAH box helicase family protein [Armatimonadetes bacterium]|nr:DEAD/DEAH box helicase family protein [Armatimonadota bacterium]NIO97819.1 DEAD/DEAH box helicase family protein [Armatimonadota bacterium]